MSFSLDELIGKLGLESYRDALLRLSRPSIELLSSPEAITPNCSKFGGIPDLPGSFQWPEHKCGPYRFIGQVNCSELPPGMNLLPPSGLLSFFYAHDENGEMFWNDPGYVRTFWFESTADCRRFSPPESVDFGSTSRIGFVTNADVPPWPWDAAKKSEWPIDETAQDAYWELRCELHPSRKYLLGFPFNTTLAYDPTPGPEWQSLLTLNSDDDLQWCWHGGDRLVTFIESSRLALRDFKEIKSDAG
jgi:uncharacterized protein YwqG